MAKQRQIEVLNDDHELDMDAGFEQELDSDLDVETDGDVSVGATQEATPAAVVLTPEAALEYLAQFGAHAGLC